MCRFVLKLSVFCLLFTVFCLTGCRKNKAPDVKTPWGLPGNKGFVDTVYTFITDAVDPEDDDVAFKFNWGDGSESGWSDYITSGETYYIKHSYSISGVYLVKAKAKDIHNNESDWSSNYKITIVAKSPPPESLTVWANVDSVCLGNPVTLYFRAVDGQGDSIKYVLYWDDKEGSQDTTRFYASGVVGQLSHTYVDTVDIGVREVIVMAVDKHGSAGDWSAPCEIIVQPAPRPDPPATPKLLDTYSVYYLQTPFSFKLTPCDSGIYYQFIWGDGDSSAWALGEVPSGGGARAVELPHPFREAGICSVTAVAKDKYGQISDPSAPCEITITNNFITEWSEGLSRPLGGVCIDYKLYVVDHYNHCIKEFTAGGSLLRVLAEDILHQPMYVDGDYDYIYVTDASDTVYKINRIDGSLVMKWGGYGSWEGRFDFPTGVAIDTGYVYVVDAQNKRVQKFTKDGVVKVVWKLPDKAMGMSISGDTLFVACNYRNVLYLFNTVGVLIDSIGTAAGGSADGQFLGLCDVAVQRDYVYVADTDNHRVQVFTKGGSFVIKWGTSDAEDEEFGTPGQFNKPQGIVVDSSGNIYVIDTLNDRVQKFEPVSKIGVF